MRRIILALALAAIALPAAAQFQRPDHLPPPGGRPGNHDLPIPHPRLIRTYYLFCTLGTSVLVPGQDVWHVRNDGRDTVPVGARLSVQLGSVLADDYVLDRAMPPGEGWDFVSGHRRSFGATTGHDECAAQAHSG